MGIVKRVAKSRSRTVWWGHLQVLAGALAVALGFLTPAVFPDLPQWVYGLAMMAAGVITYVLRSVTRKPLGEGEM